MQFQGIFVKIIQLIFTLLYPIGSAEAHLISHKDQDSKALQNIKLCENEQKRPNKYVLTITPQSSNVENLIYYLKVRLVKVAIKIE